MILRHFRKIIGFVKKDNQTPRVGKVEEGFNYLVGKTKSVILESKIIVDKLHDLQKTNYELGLFQMEKGNLGEAIFRFKIVRKFWPMNYDAHLKLIYCYYANNDQRHGDRAVERLLEMDEGFRSQIEQLRIDASFYDKSPNVDVSANENLISDNVSNKAANL